MRVVMVWRDNTDYARTVIEWLRDFEHRTGRIIESLNPDEPDGESICRAYDIVEYPSMLAIDDDGSMVRLWRGREMPRIDDVSYYTLDR